MNAAQDQPKTVPLEVLIVGAGFAGICAGIKLRKRGIYNFKILEKAGGIGGTWWHNTYPGAACDIQSHLYCYSFEPNPNWSRKYSMQAEIQAYIEHCADKYGLREHILLNTVVEEFHWHAEHQSWRAHLANGVVEQARHIIFASGGLHLPALPNIPGMADFSGPTMHSAEWNHQVDFTEKTVAIIGSAASAIQLIPELAKVASRLDVYQRTPNYVAPRNDREYSAVEKQRFARWPWLNRLYRKFIFLRGEWMLFPIIRDKRPSRWRDRAQQMLKSHIRASVTNATMRKAMVPEFPLGCKRILVADDFFNAMNRPNVHLQVEGIASIDRASITTQDGAVHPADIIVYATGFDLEKHMRQTEVTGTGGKKLSEVWADIPSAYKGGFVSGFPNFYLTTGPNTGVGTTSVVYMIEAQLTLILQAIEKTGDRGFIQVKPEAQQRYNDGIQSALQDTVWAGNCSSWYKRDDGLISTLYPYNARTYLKDHKVLVEEDFELIGT
ncbi:MAG: cation diffusion facilitator CzcD-associated flavoprotein CzcO [Halieaceae bacterium]|jgi:cation diffusion facilitator CzcD-associated flavoprotein CzcO